MSRAGLAIGMTALLLLGGVRTFAAEAEVVGAHAKHPQKTIILDDERLVPSNLQMTKGDVLVILNQSLGPMQFTFIEPKDAAERIRCHLVRRDKGVHPAAAPWLLFVVQDDQLQANVPPGRFASLCSLQPGRYVYTVAQILDTTGALGHGGQLPMKGQITVQ
jgi:hypothetical protein